MCSQGKGVEGDLLGSILSIAADPINV